MALVSKETRETATVIAVAGCATVGAGIIAAMTIDWTVTLVSMGIQKYRNYKAQKS